MSLIDPARTKQAIEHLTDKIQRTRLLIKKEQEDKEGKAVIRQDSQQLIKR